MHSLFTFIRYALFYQPSLIIRPRNKHPGNYHDVNNRMPIKWYKTVSACMFHESWLRFSEARSCFPGTLRLIKSTKTDVYLYSASVKTHFPSETVFWYRVWNRDPLRLSENVKTSVGRRAFRMSASSFETCT